LKVWGLLSGLLSRRDWVYLLGLLVPFVVYDLALKVYDISRLPGEDGFSRTSSLMRSDVFFDVGYALFWIGLFAAAKRGLLRWAVVLFFHAATVLVVIVDTCAHQYFQQNGTTLDYDTIAEWIPKIQEIAPILSQGVPREAWALLFAALFYAVFGPWLVTRAVERGLRPSGRRYRARTLRTPGFSSSLGVLLIALLFGALSPLVGSDSEGTNASFARAPFVNVVWTGMEEATEEEASPDADAAYSVSAAADASLVEEPRTGEIADFGSEETPQTQQKNRNIVLIHLESARAQSTTPYNKDLNTMPYLDELTKNSLFVEQAYVVVPRSSKATVTVNCGVDPPLFQGPEFEPNGIPAQCLADLLGEESYNSVFFQSSSEAMDQYGAVAQNLGYQEYYPSEVMDKTGFTMTNYVSYEDDIMLGPSEQWLRENGDEPFLAQYLTGTGHDEYLCVPHRYGTEDFAGDDLTNRYLNCLNYLDHFLENLINQYKELGLYEDTIFVIYGDHGEGFGEHGRFLHGDTIYEEGLRVPLLIHAPDWFADGERIGELSNQTDIVPTVLEMLGYGVQDGRYPGFSLLHPLPEDRTLRFSCITERKCLASIKGSEKYIHHYGDQPDEIFDLSEDPLEKRNLADEYSKEELDERRESLLSWHSGVNAGYGGG
jgi:phosphoglycerol transferase MdoB-like AlkP superfamily enzyme